MESSWLPASAKKKTAYGGYRASELFTRPPLDIKRAVRLRGWSRPTPEHLVKTRFGSLAACPRG